MQRSSVRRALAGFTSAVLAALSLISPSGCGAVYESRTPIGTCGDGVVQQAAGEQCDDGNKIAGDKCSPNCTIEECGNGIIDYGAGEECDDGLANDDGGDCTRSCKKAFCGDGLLKLRGKPPYEVCDDHNNENGDGCNPQCTLRGRVTALLGAVGGRGVMDGVGSAARVSGVHGFASDGRELFFFDAGACAVRGLDLSSGRVETLAGVAGQCSGPTAELRDGSASQALFFGSGTGADPFDAAHLALRGETLYVLEPFGNVLRSVDLAAANRRVTTCVADVVSGRVEAMTTHGNKLYLATYDVASDVSSVQALTLPCACNPTDPLKGACQTEVVGPPGAFDNRLIRDVAVGSAGGKDYLYVAEIARVHRIDLASGQLELIAGGQAGHRDATSGASAQFMLIRSLADAAGDGLYVVEEAVKFDALDPLSLPSGRGWASVRRVQTTPPFAVTTIAGVSGGEIDTQTPESDGFGASARLATPQTAIVADRVLFVGEDTAIRAINLASGQVATIAGVLRRDYLFYQLQAIAAHSGLLYAANREGELLELSGNASAAPRKVSVCRRPDGTVQLAVRAALVVDDQLFYLDNNLGVCRVYLSGKDRAGKPAGKAGCPTCKGTWEQIYPPPTLPLGVFEAARQELHSWDVTGMTSDGGKDLFLLGRRTRNKMILPTMTTDLAGIVRIDVATGQFEHVETATPLPAWPWGILHHAGNLYVTGGPAHQVYRIDLADRVVHAIGDGLAGNLDSTAAGGPRFCNPLGIASDGQHLFIGEGVCDRSDGSWLGNGVRQLDLADGTVTTLLGPGALPYVQLGTGRQASLNRPAGLVFDKDDKDTSALFIADTWAGAILKVD